MPRDGGWRPGASWARGGDRGDVERQIVAMQEDRRPATRELGRRSEPTGSSFRDGRGDDGGGRAGGPRRSGLGTPQPAPLVLVEQVARRQLVSAACPAALALGLVPGMPATQARALVPDLDVRPSEPEGDALLLRRLALHAVARWTPTAAPSGADGIWLDMTGVTHLHGGEERFCERLVAFCLRAGLTARVAVAGTPGAAHAIARHGAGPVSIVPAGGERSALAPLPLSALRLDAATVAIAARFGLDRVRNVLRLPRAPLAKRLGLGAVLRLDQALGDVAEPIEGVAPFQPPGAELRLLEPIGTPEQVALVAADLIALLVERCRERGVGVRAAVLSMLGVDGGERTVAFGTSRATRDPVHLGRLLGLRLDRIDPGLGIEAGTLTATRVEPLSATAAATTLVEEAPGDVATLVDRLAARVGVEAVFRVGAVQSYVPERAAARIPPLASAGEWPAWRRPTRLLGRPEPLHDVLALLPDHPPRRFSWRGRLHRVVAGDGPERIVGEWWRRDAEMGAVRDYFLVEDDAGGRYWVFRRGDGLDPGTGDLGWWVHGLG